MGAPGILPEQGWMMKQGSHPKKRWGMKKIFRDIYR